MWGCVLANLALQDENEDLSSGSLQIHTRIKCVQPLYGLQTTVMVA